MELECMDGYGHSLLRRLIAQQIGRLIDFALILLGCLLNATLVLQWAARYRAITEVWHTTSC